MSRLLLLLALLAAPALRAQDARSVALVLQNDENDDGCGPTDIVLCAVGFVVASSAFLYLSDTICGTPEQEGTCAMPGGQTVALATPAVADVIVRATPVSGLGVGLDGEARYRVEATDGQTGARLPLGTLGAPHATVREGEIPALLASLRPP